MDSANKIIFDSLERNEPSRVNLEGCDWEAVWIQARDHCLVPYILKRWTESGFIASVPKTIANRFSQATQNNAERNRQLLSTLANLCEAFRENDVPIIISKGLPVAQSYYGDLGLRVQYDLDLIVKEENRSKALEILSRKGYVPFFQRRHFHREQCLFWQPKTYSWCAEAVFDPEAPYFLDLHTKPWQPHWHGFQIECYLDLWEGANSQWIAGIPLSIPCEEKLLVHLAVHYACNVLESNARLMHLLDMILLLRSRGAKLRWDLIMNDINESSTASFCYLSFDLARRLGNIRFPDTFWNVLTRSTPTGIAEWLRMSGTNDIVSMNLRQPNRPLIYFLHWNMAASCAERMNVLLYSLHSPWREQTGIGRLTSLSGRMIGRVRHLIGRNFKGLNLRKSYTRIHKR